MEINMREREHGLQSIKSGLHNVSTLIILQ